MDRYEQLLKMTRSFESDFHKFYQKENREAGIRLRKHMQALRRLAKEIRNEVQDEKRKFDSKIPRPKIEEPNAR